ncbi:MAG: ATP-binding protein [Gemmatimonadales bacterium]|nr:ATP-binding protein [Gemmatimonadales bacterium]
MTSLFAFLGGVIGLAFWRYALRLGPAAGFELQADGAARDLSAVLAAGEGEQVEFKASARWDGNLGRINRALEETVVRSIAGFLNHRGGVLLIGVTDAGAVTGLQADFQTLKRRDRDGFQAFLMGLVQSRLGGHVCAQVHVEFSDVRGLDVCRIQVEPASAPVYYQDGPVARYYVRTGNGTRELDVREAIIHVAWRRTKAGPPLPGSG